MAKQSEIESSNTMSSKTLDKFMPVAKIQKTEANSDSLDAYMKDIDSNATR